MSSPNPRTVGPDDIDVGFVPCFRAQVEVVPLGDEAVLYNEDTGELYRLDRVARHVCDLFDGGLSITSAVHELIRRFGAPREVIEGDVLAMVRDLGRHGLLVGVDPRRAADADEAGEATPERTER